MPPRIGASSQRTYRAITLATAGAVAIVGPFALELPPPLNFLAFWLGFALATGSAVWLAVSSAISGHGRVLLLSAYGAVLWLPYFLRAPHRFPFSDELYHLAVARQIAEAGHSGGLPVTQYPIPGDYPGLEVATIGIATLASIPLEVAARILPLLVHASIPVLAYTALIPLLHSERRAMLAALLYTGNTSYFFFHSVYSYETLAIAGFLLVSASAIRGVRSGSAALFTIVVTVALTVTHHVSSFMLAIFVVVLVLARRRFKEQFRWDWLIAAVAVASPLAWLVLATERTQGYLAGTLANRIVSIIESLIGDAAPRAVFAASPLPLAERIFALTYPALVFGLVLTGLALVWSRRKRIARRGDATALALFGPLAWSVSLVGIPTSGSEIVYRSWPFLFLGVAYFAVHGIEAAQRKLHGNSRLRSLPPYLATLVIAGAVIIGDNQAGRFPQGEPTRAAGPATNTADVTAAAHWLRELHGPLNLVNADSGTQAVFSTEGLQRARRWGSWLPFYKERSQDVQADLEAAGVDFLVVDRRITQLLPRYGTYFGQVERAYAREIAPGPLDPELIEKFDLFPFLDRIYDNGNVQIYAVREDTE